MVGPPTRSWRTEFCGAWNAYRSPPWFADVNTIERNAARSKKEYEPRTTGANRIKTKDKRSTIGAPRVWRVGLRSFLFCSNYKGPSIRAAASREIHGPFRPWLSEQCIFHSQTSQQVLNGEYLRNSDQKTQDATRVVIRMILYCLVCRSQFAGCLRGCPAG